MEEGTKGKKMQREENLKVGRIKYLLYTIVCWEERLHQENYKKKNMKKHYMHVIALCSMYLKHIFKIKVKRHISI